MVRRIQAVRDQSAHALQTLHDIIQGLIEDFKSWGGPTHQQIWQASYVYNGFLKHPDYSEPGQLRIARAVAALAFRPGGVTFNGKRYEAC
jgi:hypothetical protein